MPNENEGTSFEIEIEDGELSQFEVKETEGAGATELESQITGLLEKDSADLTDDEKSILEKNDGVVNKLAADAMAREKAAEEGKGGESEEGEEEGDELGAIDAFAKNEGFVDEAKFEDNVDGLQGYIEKRDSKRDLVVLGSFLEANSQVKDFYQHVVVDKKPPETFMQELSKPEILETEVKPIPTTGTDNEKQTVIDNHLNIIRADLKGKVPDSVIEATIKSAVEMGQTEILAKDSLANLNASHQRNIDAVNKEAADAKQLAIDAKANAEKVITSLVTKGELASNVNIPDAEKKGFTEFLTIPVESVTQRTKYDKTLADFTPQEDMLIDWLVYQKYKNGKIDLSSLQRKSTSQKFIKNAKKANESREKGASGSRAGQAFENISSMPSSY